MTFWFWFSSIPAESWIFYAFAIFTVAGAAGVAFSQNIVYAAFSLLAAFAGMVGLFGFMSADFLAIIQLMVYVGGILVLILFAVMLTNKITEIKHSNPIGNPWMGAVLCAALAAVLGLCVFTYPWSTRTPAAYAPTTATIGNAFLGRYLLPFEVAGVMLLSALLAAVVVACKEVKREDLDAGVPSKAGGQP